MDRDKLDKQLQNYKIREGPLLKRSRFLKEWRQRWTVLTFNYIMTFTNKTCQEVTDVLDLRTLKSYKSYVSKSEEMIPASFKIRSGDTQLYFCAKNTQEKWSWIVTLERLLDYKEVGANSYNNLTFVKTKGFPSLEEYMNPKVDISEEMANYKTLLKAAEKRRDELEKESIEMAKKIFKEQEAISQEKDEIRKEKARIQLLKDEIEGVRNKTQEEHTRISVNKEFEEGNVKKLAALYESKSIEHNKIKGELLKSKENVVDGIFNQFEAQSQEYFGFKYFVDFLILIASDARLSYQTHIINAIKAHPNSKTFLQIFIQIITQYQPVQNSGSVSRISMTMTVPQDIEYMQNLLKFVNLLLRQKLQPLFQKTEVEIMKNKLKQILATDEADSSEQVQILLQAMSRMNKISKYKKIQVEERLIRIHKLSKKENISNLAKQLLNSL